MTAAPRESKTIRMSAPPQDDACQVFEHQSTELVVQCQALANPVTSGNSTTLTVSNIIDTNPGATITQVAIYMDSNGDGMLDSGDTLIGYATQTSPGVWTLAFTVSLAPGSYTLFAEATDSLGVLGADSALLNLTVQ